MLLPEAWTILPAATADLVLLRRYFGRSGRRGELERVAVADRHGTVHRSATLPWDVNSHAVGEVTAGGVTWAGIAGWDGEVYPLPAEVTGNPYTDPRPFGVLDGRVIVFEHVDYLESVDTRTGSRHTLSVPAEPREGGGSRSDFRTTRPAITRPGRGWSPAAAGSRAARTA